MSKNYENCVSDIKKKLKQGKMKKTFRCDSEGNTNQRGKNRCKSNPHALCSKIK